MKDEIWTSVPGYEGFYEVSSMGRVRSVSRWVPCVRNPEKKQFYHGRVLKPGVNMNPYGYLQVNLSKRGKTKPGLVHRLVAMAFIPNPDSLREVNHINGDKHDNRVVNLEWCSSKENKKHAHALGLYTSEKAVKCVETGVVYRTQKEAAEVVGVHPNTIGKACLGRRKTAKGFHWQFV